MYSILVPTAHLEGSGARVPSSYSREAAGEALPSTMLSVLFLLILAALPAGTDMS